MARYPISEIAIGKRQIENRCEREVSVREGKQERSSPFYLGRKDCNFTNRCHLVGIGRDNNVKLK